MANGDPTPCNDNGPFSDAPAPRGLIELNEMIATLPADSQLRIGVMAGILRNLLNSDTSGEAELAFSLVLTEITE